MHTGDRYRAIVGAVIVVVWVSSIAWDASHPDYEVPLTVHGAMMLVAGYLFGPALVGRKNGNGTGAPPDKEGLP